MNTQSPSAVPAIDDWSKLLSNRIAVVTGGGSDGIGGAISRLFAEHGAIVEIAEIDEERAERCRSQISEHGGAARAHVVDVTDQQGVSDFADDVLGRHGRIDVLVNNVGDYRPLVRFDKSGPESWQKIYELNLLHFFLVTRAFLPSMIERHRGSIVNVHSVEGMRGYAGDPVYGAMKAGVAHFTTCLAANVGRRGVRVNGIGPDLTQTPQVDYISGYEDYDHLWECWAPAGRLGWPEDQARVALFLASDASSFITGHNIPVDGGTKAGAGWFFSRAEHRFVNRPKAL